MNIKQRANEILVSVFGRNARFREGQYEAIESCFTHQKSLVIQKTGWGKSLVYFMATKLNRENGKGVTLVISPLLVLMENQIEAASKFCLKSTSIDSGKSDEEKKHIIEKLKNNEYDVLFITPESLYSGLRPHLDSIQIGMLVIDEVHCISDWGHDFRMSYRKLYEALNQLKSVVPILCTTATSNERVINDLKEQIGYDLYISRGKLFRDNISITTLKFENKANRFAWVLDNIPLIDGSGIIYCLTKKECDDLNLFLNQHGITSRPFYSGLPKEETKENIKLFSENKIKVIIATTKLGLGYDKPDIAFVIHFQLPKNIVTYYQQVGRVARDKTRIPVGKSFVLMVDEDKDILDYFIDGAFPSEEQMKTILKIVEDGIYGKEGGTSVDNIVANTNLSKSAIGRSLDFLYFENYVNKTGNYYTRNPDPKMSRYIYKGSHYSELTEIRRNETKEILHMFETKECLNKYIVSSLDNSEYQNCGICANCTKTDYVMPQKQTILLATNYINKMVIAIIPRKTYLKDKLSGRGFRVTPENMQLFKEKGYCTSSNGNVYSRQNGWDIRIKNGSEYLFKEKECYENLPGIALSKYGSEPYGKVIAECKKLKIEYPEIILERCLEVIKKQMEETDFVGITFVPSNNNTLMNNLALRIASKLGIKYYELIQKTNNVSQKSMNNRVRQRENSENSYSLATTNVKINGNIILIDDMVDSGCTFAYCGKLLLDSSLNCKNVFPLALADSSKGSDYDD